MYCSSGMYVYLLSSTCSCTLICVTHLLHVWANVKLAVTCTIQSCNFTTYFSLLCNAACFNLPDMLVFITGTVTSITL